MKLKWWAERLMGRRIVMWHAECLTCGRHINVSNRSTRQAWVTTHILEKGHTKFDMGSS